MRISPLLNSACRGLSPFLVLGVALALVSAGCSRWPRRPTPAAPVVVAPSAPRPPAPPLTVPPPAQFHVLMINGGHDAANNYQSHLLHVRNLLELLRAAGITTAHIAIFSADGADPAADLAVREPETAAQLWRLSGTTLEERLRAPITYINSAVPDVELHAAKKDSIGQWFDDAHSRFQSGDTLLLYVTDHGTKNPEDLTDNRITLWGTHESLSVHELRGMLAKLNPGVRVVALMSQCFSGSFAYLTDTPDNGGLPSGAVCGYFSSIPERRAYGCYPENRGRDNVGHSFHFLQALAATGSFPDAQSRVLVTDASPDVPLTTSDEYLHTRLGAAAAASNLSFAELVDALLKEAWHNKGAWEPEIRLLDRIGVAYGCFSPRSLAELDQQAQQLPDISNQFLTVSYAWKGTLADANQANVDRFLEASPQWKERVSTDAVRKLDAEARRSLLPSFLDALGTFTETAPTTAAQLQTLNEKGDAAAAATYRMEVRLAVILRMRTILTSIAGQVFLATRATPAERAAYDALKRCEALGLPATPRGNQTLATTEPFPPFDEDVQRAQAALPAWMGIQFREPSPERRQQAGLQDGAAAVMTVYPETPAAQAGLQIGDIVIGPPHQPFAHHGQIREWTMLAPAGTAQTLDVLRDDRHLQLSLSPAPYPLKWPELPGPPKLSSPAPPITKLAAYRGTLPPSLAGGTPHLLFFWATWCGPCKASLPEVLAFEKERDTPVIAITDELPDRLDAFFAAKTGPFPQAVAVDEFRRAFVAYGVSGTPTFVLVDGSGVVRSYASGYTPANGLGIDGWTWAGRASK